MADGQQGEVFFQLHIKNGRSREGQFFDLIRFIIQAAEQTDGAVLR